MRPLIWFRADLRVADNPALHAASERAASGAVAVFVVCPRQWQEHDWSDWRVDLLLRSLPELRAGLHTLGIPLRILETETFGDVPRALSRLARGEQCDALFFNDEHEVHELRRDEAVETTFTTAGLAVHRFLDQILVAPDALRTGQGNPYSVFTPFRKAWLKRIAAHGLPRLLGEPKVVAARAPKSDPLPEKVKGFRRVEGAADLWPAGEQVARERLQTFAARRLGEYHALRDLPAVDGTSRISPYLALGLISPRRCLEVARRHNRGRLAEGKPGADVWITELLWREFYRHVLVNFPRVCMNRPFREETEAVAWREDPEAFDAWCEGQTGFPIVDAAMRQLRQIGWMHNRMRMVVSMFLTKDLLIDWRRGEQFFMRNLVDGDLASNNGGWQWSASTGNDAAPYFRIFNPTTQGRKFDGKGEYLRSWVRELREVEGAAVHDPSVEVRDRVGYPQTIVDHKAARERTLAAFRAARG